MLLKCDIVDGSVINGLIEPVLYSLVPDKPPAYKVFCQLETIYYIRTKQICFEEYNIFFKIW